MHSIPHSLTVTNLHKRHRTELEDPASSKRTKAETRCVADKQPKSEQLQPPGINLLNSLTTVLARTVIEWLDEADALQLMVVGKIYHQYVLASYYSRLKPKLPDQPCPLPLSYPIPGDKLAQWIIDENSSSRLKPDNRVLPKSKYVVVKRYRPGPDESSLDGYRPPFGPSYEIVDMWGENLPSTIGISESVYVAEIEPNGAEKDHPIFLYRDPRFRCERHLTDQIGKDYLAAKKIYHPLSTRIGKNPGMTVAQAGEFIKAQRQWMTNQISSGTLSKQQCETFKNRLFAEHVACQRIDRPTALQLAKHGKILFYCLSLITLFRTGTITLTTVSEMSDDGRRLLHDPRLVQLLYKGILSERQVRTLTQTQYRSLLLLVHPLLTRQLRSSDALTLTAKQVEMLRKAELLEDLACCRISLKQALAHLEQKPKSPEPFALHVFGGAASSSPSIGVHEMLPADVASLMSVWPVEEMGKVLLDEDGNVDEEWVSAFIRVRQLVPSLGQHTISGDTLSIIKPRLCQSEEEHQKYQPGQKVGVPLTDVALLLSRMPPVIVRDVIYGEGVGGNEDWVTQFGKIVPLMPFERIMAFLDTLKRHKDSTEELFSSFEEPGADEVLSVAQAFNQIFIDLAAHLDAEEYLKLAELYLNNLLSFMAVQSWKYCCPEIIDQCSEIWSLVQSKCVITGETVDRYRDLALNLLKAASWDDAFTKNVATHSRRMMAAFASFMVAMELEDDEEFLKLWTDDIFSEQTTIDRFQQNCFDTWRRAGINYCHAIFSPFHASEYAATARGCMSIALDKGADDVAFAE